MTSRLAPVPHESANGEGWKLVAKPVEQIAPRRSPVRARLAPFAKDLQERIFRFQRRQRMSRVVKFWSNR